MKTVQKGLAVAVIQILIVLSAGGKLLYDRATKPRVWVRTASIDPDLPIRGRYLTLNLEVHNSESVQPTDPKHPGLYSGAYYVNLAVENGQLVAHKTERPTGMTINSWAGSAIAAVIFLCCPLQLSFFFPSTLTLRGWAEMANSGPRSRCPKKVRLVPFNSPLNAATNGHYSLIADLKARCIIFPQTALSASPRTL